jgi:hypothetical protein
VEQKSGGSQDPTKGCRQAAGGAAGAKARKLTITCSRCLFERLSVSTSP